MSLIRIPVLLTILAMSSLIGCGQTGDLFLPEASEPISSSEEADEADEEEEESELAE